MILPKERKKERMQNLQKRIDLKNNYLISRFKKNNFKFFQL